MIRFPIFLFSLLLGAIQVMAQPEGEVAPLFQDAEPIQITLHANYKALTKDRADERSYHPALITYSELDGSTQSMPIKMMVRGNFRRQRSNCQFPPLRLNFKKGLVKQTLFAGQDKLKLVTHCQKATSYQRYILQEYLVYRTYNLLTDYSFRVRLVEVTYQDSSAKAKPVVRYGFLIEDDDEMAKRLNGRILDVKSVHPKSTNAEAEVLLSLFQYMVGNTDWSIPALHNIRLYGAENPNLPPIPIPYDFDWCGVVNTHYAEPAPKLGIQSIRERVYRGFSHAHEVFDSARATLQEKKQAIFDLYQNFSPLPDKDRAQALKYYEEFFRILDDPDLWQKNILAKARTDK